MAKRAAARAIRNAWIALFAALAFCSAASLALGENTNTPLPSKLAATSYGAAGRVSGSMHLLDTGNARCIVDCGVLFDEETAKGRLGEKETARLQAVFPPAALAATALFITHAHADHIGRVPLLVHSGFNGPIFCTPATRDLAEVTFASGLRYESSYPRHWTWSKRAKLTAENARKAFVVHLRDCADKKAIAADDREEADATTDELQERFKSQKPRVKINLCQDCLQDELEGLMKHFHAVPYGQKVDVAPGVQAEFIDAGHIPGSASVLFTVTFGGQTRKVLFSGDLGNDLSPQFAGPKPVPAVDAVFCEATYGAADRGPEVASQRAEFRKALAEVAARRGIAWIPAFAMDRTQKILYEIHLAQKEKLLPDPIPVYCSSPTARAITDLYRKHQHDGWFSAEVAGDPDAWSPHVLRATVPSYSSLPRPCIVISTTDLTKIPWMQRLATDLLANKDNALFTVGYSDPESLAGQIKAGVDKVTIDGREVKVRAASRSFECFTGHGSAADIDRWLTNVSKQAIIVLVHGSPESLKARAEQLHAAGWGRVLVAEDGKAIELMSR